MDLPLSEKYYYYLFVYSQLLQRIETSVYDIKAKKESGPRVKATYLNIVSLGHLTDWLESLSACQELSSCQSLHYPIDYASSSASQHSNLKPNGTIVSRNGKQIQEIYFPINHK